MWKIVYGNLVRVSMFSKELIMNVGAGSQVFQLIKCSYLHDKRLLNEVKEMCEFILENAPSTLETHRNELS